MTPHWYQRGMDTQVYQGDQTSLVEMGPLRRFRIRIKTGRVMEIQEAAPAQAVGIAVLAAGHPGPGQGAEALGELTRPSVQDPGQWRADRRRSCHLIDHTFCVPADLHRLICNMQIRQRLQAIDQGEVFSRARPRPAIPQENPKTACNLLTITLYQPAVAQ